MVIKKDPLNLTGMFVSAIDEVALDAESGRSVGKGRLGWSRTHPFQNFTHSPIVFYREEH